MGVELVWSASPLGGTSSMPSACVESGSGARSFPFRAWRISRSIIREVSARIARRSRHGNPRYRSAGIVTLEPWRLVAPWIGHTYSGASPDRSCARASRRIGTESNRRGLGRSRQSWIGVCLMAVTWLERPGDAEIAGYARLWDSPDQIDERRRQQRGVLLVGERKPDPADQQREREGLVRVLDVVPARRHAVRERGMTISAGSPRRCPPWDCMSSTAASSSPPVRSGQVRTECLLPSRFQARSRASRQAGSSSQSRPRRSAAPSTRSRPVETSDRRARRPGAADSFVRASAAGACQAVPGRSPPAPQGRSCDSPPRRTDPATLVLWHGPGAALRFSGGTLAPDLARLRSGTKIIAG